MQTDLVIPVFNVAIFCYIAQYAVLNWQEVWHDQQKLAPAIVTGTSLTMVCWLCAAGSTFADGPEITQVATIAWGKALGEWAAFYGQSVCSLAMMTSYWAVAAAFSYQHRGISLILNRRTMLRPGCLFWHVVIPPFISRQRLAFVDIYPLVRSWCHYVRAPV